MSSDVAGPPPVTTSTIGAEIKRAATRLPHERAVHEARLLLGYVLQKSPEHLMAYPEKPLAAVEVDRFSSLMERRSAGEPIAKIIGEKEFWSLPFYTTTATLDPRPESELMIEAVLERFSPDASLKILDLGTGTGCLLLSLLYSLPNSQGVGVDISAAALAVAQKNAHRLELFNRSTWLQADWTSALKGTFDVIVSNPPYIAEGDMAGLSQDVKNYDPHLALLGGKDGLDAYRSLAKGILSLCNDETLIVFEVGWGQAEKVIEIFISSGYQHLLVKQDLQGVFRCLVLKKQ